MIEQAAYERSHNAIQLKSQTAGFSEAWLLEAERLIVGFGDPFVADTLEDWGHCVFAQPLAQRSVAVVRVHTQGIDESRKLTGLVFRFFILPHRSILVWAETHFTWSSSSCLLGRSPRGC